MKSRQRYDSISHLSGDELLRFHRHEQFTEEEKLVNEHLKHCELCSDALKGMAEMNNELNIVNIIHDLRRNMRHKFTPKKKIVLKFELITILITFFVIGIILLTGYYFLILKK